MSTQQMIADGAAAMGLDLPRDAVDKLAAYLELMSKWNKVHNLTAVRETEDMVTLHILDSLSVLPHIEGATQMVDVGTGAGLPGIPVAIARPAMRVTLLDSSHKKCAFLEQAKAELGLANVTVMCGRVEEWKPEAGFDAVVSRAFSDLADFVAQAKHLLAPGGRLVAMKGVYPFEEIARIPASHKVAEVVELRVPKLDARRHVVLVEAA